MLEIYGNAYLVCMYVCMYVCICIWMDGWMDGWIDRYHISNRRLRIFHRNI